MEEREERSGLEVVLVPLLGKGVGALMVLAFTELLKAVLHMDRMIIKALSLGWSARL